MFFCVVAILCYYETDYFINLYIINTFLFSFKILISKLGWIQNRRLTKAGKGRKPFRKQSGRVHRTSKNNNPKPGRQAEG